MSKSKKSTGTSVLDKIEAVPTPKATTKMVPVIKATKHAQVDADASGEKKKPGRPAVEGSERQIKLAAMNEKRAKGELKRGRPAVPGSDRQIREADKKAKMEAGLLTGKQGRPSDPTSARQLKLSTRNAMVSAGIWNGKPGRPAVKTEIVEYREVPTDAPDFILQEVTEEAPAAEVAK